MTATIERPLDGPMAWTTRTLAADAGRIRLGPEVLSELAEAGRALAANPLPTEALALADFALPATRARMAEVGEALEDGIGFAIIDRLPLAETGPAVATQLYWLMMSMIAPPVAQRWDGTMIYEITDNGQKTAPGNGVRSSETNAGQGYHTDNAFDLPPDYVGLLCLQPAMEGGVSGLISFEAVHNRLLAEAAEALGRLYQPVWYDRQLEHAPDDAPLSRKPVFHAEDGRLAVTLSPRLVRQGYAVAGEAMDAALEAAMAALREACEAPGMGREFVFAPGQIQIINNRRLGHRRSAFTDWPDPARKRRLVRLWLRRHGRPFYHG